MDNEIVLKLSGFIKQYSDNIEERSRSVKLIVDSMTWEGGSRDDYVNLVNALLIKISSFRLEAENLNILLQHEVDQWLEADRQGSDNIGSVKTIAVGIGVAVSSGFSGFWKSITRPYLEINFSHWWDELSSDERIVYLEEEQTRIADALGIDHIPLEIKDLEDPSYGDYQGAYSPEDGKMYLDVDNIQSDNPWDLINTMAHEMRHRKQHEAVQYYQTTGKPPEGISQSEVETWQSEIENYISHDEDFEAYRSQAIEVDARSYGNEYVDIVFDNKPWND
mgnify:CR=1 FL=1